MARTKGVRTEASQGSFDVSLQDWDSDAQILKPTIVRSMRVADYQLKLIATVLGMFKKQTKPRGRQSGSADSTIDIINTLSFGSETGAGSSSSSFDPSKLELKKGSLFENFLKRIVETRHQLKEQLQKSENVTQEAKHCNTFRIAMRENFVVDYQDIETLYQFSLALLKFHENTREFKTINEDPAVSKHIKAEIKKTLQEQAEMLAVCAETVVTGRIASGENHQQAIRKTQDILRNVPIGYDIRFLQIIKYSALNESKKTSNMVLRAIQKFSDSLTVLLAYTGMTFITADRFKKAMEFPIAIWKLFYAVMNSALNLTRIAQATLNIRYLSPLLFIGKVFGGLTLGYVAVYSFLRAVENSFLIRIYRGQKGSKFPGITSSLGSLIVTPARLLDTLIYNVLTTVWRLKKAIIVVTAALLFAEFFNLFTALNVFGLYTGIYSDFKPWFDSMVTDFDASQALMFVEKTVYSLFFLTVEDAHAIFSSFNPLGANFDLTFGISALVGALATFAYNRSAMIVNQLNVYAANSREALFSLSLFSNTVFAKFTLQLPFLRSVNVKRPVPAALAKSVRPLDVTLSAVLFKHPVQLLSLYLAHVNKSIRDAANAPTPADAASDRTPADAASDRTPADAASDRTPADAASDPTTAEAASVPTRDDAAKASASSPRRRRRRARG